MPRPAVRLDIPAYDYAAARRLAAEVGVSHLLAQVLVRRGYAEPEAARAFLAAEETHPLDAFGGLREAAARMLEHAHAGTRITVHGDYDVDGVCSTAILVRALRTLGADVDWYLPSRTEDGYGLAAATVARLAARGTGLLVTTDCGITSVEEVAAAHAAGLDVIVTDHHSPRADGALPDAPIVHPRVGDYPCPDLCAAGVAHKLAAALLEADGLDPRLADEDLDLVALATVADVVALRGENRSLVRRGLRRLAGTRKAGLRALMDVARVDPGGIDAGAIGFRLAPRLNAAGRLRRADAALELILCEDPARAAVIAAELDAGNAERRDVETRILFQAEAQVAAAPPDAPAYVLAGTDWHPGVIGIVASRIAERHHRPAVLIALQGGTGTGSGRSIPGFDLLAGLDAAAAHLERHGGHRAAAGLTIAAERVDDFRAAFAAHAATVLTPDLLLRRERIDAVVPGDVLDLETAEEITRLAPFGMGNPAVALLVPGARLQDPRPMGEGRHVAFTLESGGARSRAVSFGGGPRLPAEEGVPVDAAVRLEVNAYNGAQEPRLVLRHACLPAPAPIELVGEPAGFSQGVARELERVLEPWPAEPPSPASGERELCDARGGGIAGLLGDLTRTGDGVLGVCAHAPHRARGLSDRVGGFGLVSWGALEDAPEVAAGFAHVVAIDPPAHAHLDALLRALPGAGWTHLAWGDAELRFAARILEWDYELTTGLRDLYRALRAAAPVAGSACEALLRGDGRQPRSAALAGRLLRVLSELALAQIAPGCASVRCLPAAQRTELERSAAFRAYGRRLEDGRRWLSRATQRAAA